MVRCHVPYCSDEYCLHPYPGQRGYEKADRDAQKMHDKYHEIVLQRLKNYIIQEKDTKNKKEI